MVASCHRVGNNVAHSLLVILIDGSLTTLRKVRVIAGRSCPGLPKTGRPRCASSVPWFFTYLEFPSSRTIYNNTTRQSGQCHRFVRVILEIRLKMAVRFESGRKHQGRYPLHKSRTSIDPDLLMVAGNLLRSLPTK